jgi:hypothetical protein
MSFVNTVSRAPAIGYEGMLSDTRASRVASKTPATGTIKAGRAVCFHAGDSDEMVRLPATAAEVQNNNIQGVTVLDVTRMSDAGTVGAGTAATESMAVLTDGELLVRAEEAVTEASLVYIRITESTGGAADTGQFRASADSGKAVIAYGFKFLGSCGAGELVRLSVKLPQGNVALPTGA